MKKFSIVLIVILIIALGVVTSLYIREKNLNEKSNKEEGQSVIGTYFNENWNGRNATLVIKEDGTCKYPTGSTGTWTLEDGVIKINLGKIDMTGVYPGGTIQDDIHNASVMKNGVILHDHFFEKMD